ncbi:EpsD family peptidyl-prolyl cis-trans isomerase [Massilia antarctica]|nr:MULTISPECIES: EpsD family peptidyl-prolyl cis-trans isomerase [Massilia]MCY0914744.1 EpsD family peptidyl-prolyl cis-trans isomerase [Massilia sp. H27-R4]CUI08220.1 PPIC-type PPIASE domain protein [Janthinobacterium sp. CG23_2]CUU32006.1 PPIC-type PPIASE domain protein [Janthinobacterium sp. CG23_2]
MNNSTLAMSPPSHKRLLCAALMVALAGLAGCGNKDSKPKVGQALVSVNGEEITELQLSEELMLANVPPAQQAEASKKLVEALIDRQLLQNEAAKEKADRDPKVVQAIERAKALIIAQYYMQKKVGSVARPSAADISQYYTSNPDFFAARKQFDMKQLVIQSKDLSEEVKKVAENAKSLDDVAVWFDTNKIKYMRAQASRTTSDLAPEMSAKLKSMPKNQLFIVKEGERSMLVAIVDVRDNPASLEVASPQIEKFLFNKRTKEAADAELKRLRAAAKIDYLKTPALAAAPAAGTVPAAPAPVAATPAPAQPDATPATSDAATARGVAGLK